MPSLIDQERAKYEQMWAVEEYAVNSPGEQYLPIFLDMAKPRSGATVLDAGCGSGRGAIALGKAGFDVSGCDLTRVDFWPDEIPFTEACLWHELAPKIPTVDWVYCCDVLEHIPTAFTMLVIARLLSVAREGVFFSISTVPDIHGAWIGTALHQTVQPFVWWRDAIRELGTLVEARDLLIAGCYLVRP
jgi:SAM-dependent methyltransferase